MKDENALIDLLGELWPDSPIRERGQLIREYETSPEAMIAVEYDGDIPVGIALCSLRHDYVEGCDTSPVGYLEGIYVRETHRNRGIAGKLLRICEDWAACIGCSEFASDCELNNTDSLAFHLRMGFSEENRIICFKKSLRKNEN